MEALKVSLKEQIVTSSLLFDRSTAVHAVVLMFQHSFSIIHTAWQVGAVSLQQSLFESQYANHR